jgi:hypothetical protein
VAERSRPLLSGQATVGGNPVSARFSDELSITIRIRRAAFARATATTSLRLYSIPSIEGYTLTPPPVTLTSAEQSIWTARNGGEEASGAHTL